MHGFMYVFMYVCMDGWRDKCISLWMYVGICIHTQFIQGCIRTHYNQLYSGPRGAYGRYKIVLDNLDRGKKIWHSHMCLHMDLCLCVCGCVSVSVCLCICLSVYHSVCAPVCLSAYLSVCLSVCLYPCLSVCESLYRSLPVYLSLCPCHYGFKYFIDVLLKSFQVNF